MSTTNVTRWVMTAQGEPCARVEEPLAAPAAGEAVVQVAGCGVCHTDISFLHQGVPTRAALPLALALRRLGLPTLLDTPKDRGAD